MKAKRRVVTASGAGAPVRRRPTVRKVKSAIVPAPPKPAVPKAPASVAARPQPAAPSPEPAERDAAPTSVDLTVDIGRGLVLPNPILVASGTFGYGV